MDEKKQIKEMAEVICGSGMVDTYSRCEIIAEELYIADYRKQSGWISVDERLPERQCSVLAYYGFKREGDDDLGYMLMGVIEYYAFDPNPHFQHESVGLRVTHWMPLPEAPKGE